MSNKETRIYNEDGNCTYYKNATGFDEKGNKIRSKGKE